MPALHETYCDRALSHRASANGVVLTVIRLAIHSNSSNLRCLICTHEVVLLTQGWVQPSFLKKPCSGHNMNAEAPKI